MRQYDTRQIVFDLIGKTEPYGDTRIDERRLENTKELIDLDVEIIDQLILIASYKDHYAASICRIAELAHKRLMELKEYLNDEYNV